MQTLNYRFPAQKAASRAVHIGVVASGDLEILLEPPAVDDPPDSVVVRVRTSVNGFDTIWHDVLERFFSKNREEATRIMLHVHKKGVGLCGVFTYEVAETKVSQVLAAARQAQHPLQCTMEKE